MGSEVFGCERVRMKEEVSGSMLVKLCEVGWRRHSRRRFKKKKKSSGSGGGGNKKVPKAKATSVGAANGGPEPAKLEVVPPV